MITNSANIALSNDSNDVTISAEQALSQNIDNCGGSKGANY